MTKLLQYSRRYHWLIFTCLTLPFFYTGCDKQDEEGGSIATATTDTVVDSPQTKTDAYSQDSSHADSVDSTAPLANTTRNDKEEKTVSLKLLNRFPFLKPILLPRPDTHSGLAVVIDTFPYISLFGTFLFALFLSLSLVVKYFKDNSFKTVVLLDSLTLLFLTVSNPVAFNSHRLWGYWVTLGLVVLLTIFDFYILYKEIDDTKKGRA